MWHAQVCVFFPREFSKINPSGEKWMWTECQWKNTEASTGFHSIQSENRWWCSALAFLDGEGGAQTGSGACSRPLSPAGAKSAREPVSWLCIACSRGLCLAKRGILKIVYLLRAHASLSKPVPSRALHQTAVASGSRPPPLDEDVALLPPGLPGELWPRRLRPQVRTYLQESRPLQVTFSAGYGRNRATVWDSKFGTTHPFNKYVLNFCLVPGTTPILVATGRE